jgi:hypothetical protein
MSDQQKISAGFVIMNPLTGHPRKQTPSGMSLENVTFSTKEELVKFVNEHWANPVFMADGKDLLSPQ